MDKQALLMRLRAQAIRKAVKADQKATRSWQAYAEAEHRAGRDAGTPKYARSAAKARAKHALYQHSMSELNRSERARERASQRAFPKAKRYR